MSQVCPMRIYRNETRNTNLENIWALLDAIEDDVQREMIDAIRHNDKQRFYRLCSQVNKLDYAQDIYKKLRNGRSK